MVLEPRPFDLESRPLTKRLSHFRTKGEKCHLENLGLVQAIENTIQLDLQLGVGEKFTVSKNYKNEVGSPKPKA